MVGELVTWPKNRLSVARKESEAGIILKGPRKVHRPGGGNSLPDKVAGGLKAKGGNRDITIGQGVGGREGVYFASSQGGREAHSSPRRCEKGKDQRL